MTEYNVKQKYKNIYFICSTCSWKWADTAITNSGKKSKYYFQVNFRISHHISWNLGDLLKCYKTEYTPSRLVGVKNPSKSKYSEIIDLRIAII